MSVNYGPTAANPVTLTPSPQSLSLIPATHSVIGVNNNQTDVVAGLGSLSFVNFAAQVNNDVIARPTLQALTLSGQATSIDFVPVQGNVTVDVGTQSLPLTSANPFLQFDNDALYALSVPNWINENNYYAFRGLTTNGKEDVLNAGNSAEKITVWQGTTEIADGHGNTEVDDLWNAYHQYKRLATSRPTASAAWYDRAQSIADWLKVNYIGSAQWDSDLPPNNVGVGHDHFYGYGLCDWAEGEGDAVALNYIDSLRAEMVTWDTANATSIGQDLAAQGSAWGRRWGRQLRFACRAQEVKPNASNLAWRDRCIDLVLQSSGWDPTWNMYWLQNQGGTTTDDRIINTGFTYATGGRCAVTFHMGIIMEALWHAWRVLESEGDSRRYLCAQRLVDMATYYRDFPPDADGFMNLNTGYVISGGSIGTSLSDKGSGSPDGVYSLGPVNGLVDGFKMTGDQSYLDRARELYENWQASYDLSSSAGNVHHYVDSVIGAGAGAIMAYNKSELFYTYALFENGDVPTLVNDVAGVTGYKPKWYTDATDLTLINLTSEVGTETFSQQDLKQSKYYPNWTFGSDYAGTPGDYHTAQFSNWNDGFSRPNYYVIMCSGGHNGSSQNGCYELGPWLSESPGWHHYGTDPSKYDIPSHSGAPDQTIAPGEWDGFAQNKVTYYTDGKPNPGHSYYQMNYIDVGDGTGIMHQPWRSYHWNGPYGSPGRRLEAVRWVFPDERDVGGYYEAQATYPDWPGKASESGGVTQDKNGVVWVFNATGGAVGTEERVLKTMDIATGVYTTVGNVPNVGNVDHGNAYSPDHDIIIKVNDSLMAVIDIRDGGQTSHHISVSHSDTTGITTQADGAHPNISYDKVGQKFVAWDGGTTFAVLTILGNYRDGNGRLNSGATYAWTQGSLDPSNVEVPDTPDGGTIPKFDYVDELGGFVCIPNEYSNVYFLKCEGGL